MGLGLVNGTVRTMTGKTEEAVLIDGCRVAEVGDSDAIRQAAERCIDLDGKTVIPGFNDAHTHFFAVGHKERHVDLMTAETKTTAVQRLEQAAREADGLVLGKQADDYHWAEPLTAADLNRISRTRPIVVTHVTGHTVFLNAAAQERFGHDTGTVRDSDAFAVIQELVPDGEALDAVLQDSIDVAHRHGVTSVQDVLLFGEDAAYKRLDARGDLDLRVTGMQVVSDAADITTLARYEGDRFHIGMAKLFVDGAFSAATAAISDTYASGGNGSLLCDTGFITDVVQAAEQHDMQVCGHAIGDRAVRTLVDGVAAVMGRERRHRIEHLEAVAAADLARAADQGMVASMQPNFLQWEPVYRERLPDSIQPIDQHAAVADELPLAFGSDVMPFGPLYGIHQAVNAGHRTQQVDVRTAVAAYTRGSAYAEHAEDSKGVVAPGMLADLAVLAADPWQRPERIADIPVAMTVLDGEVVYRRED
jgi:predicted amidohydrolase YtcJ